MLWKAVKDILQIAGYDIAVIEQEFILNSKDGHIAGPPRGVAGYTSSSLQSKIAVELVNQSANKVK
jgi:hypothetical protein